MQRSKAVTILAIGITIGLLAGGAFAWAAIPDSSSSTISGCYLTKTGRLRVVDAQAGKVCKRNETPLSWNQTGPQGPRGLPGPTSPDSNVRLINLPESYTNVNGTVGYGPVDVADCRRISFHATMTTPVAMTVKLYAARSSSATAFGFVSQGAGQLGSSGVVYAPTGYRAIPAARFSVTTGGTVSLPAAYVACETMAAPVEVIDLPETFTNVPASTRMSFGLPDVSQCKDVSFHAETVPSTGGEAELYSAMSTAGPIVGFFSTGAVSGTGAVSYFPANYLPIPVAHFTLLFPTTASASDAWLACEPFNS